MALGKRLINTGGVAACTTDTADVFGDSNGIALYTLDYDASDASGTYDGTPSNVTFGVGGQINYGARFNGSSSKIALPNVINFSTGEHTISAWINTTSTSVTRFISNLYTGTVPDGSIDFVWIPASNSISVDFSIGGSNYTNTITGISTGQWYHIAATFVNNGTCTAYLNGSSVDTVIAPSFTATAYQPLNLGYYERGNNYWSGSIDQVRIFSKSLSSDEVATLWNSGNGETACVYTATTTDNYYPLADGSSDAVAYYKLDNSSEDYVGSNDGTDTNIEYRFGRFGQAAVFNNDSAITTSFNIGRTNDFTISFWIKDITDSNYGSYADKWVMGVYNNDYIPINYNKTSGKVSYLVHDGTTLLGTLQTPVLDDNWHHIVFTQDVNVETKLYVDGVLQTSETVSHTSMTQRRSVSGGTGFYFGQNPSNTSTDLRLKGSVDQVRIYSTALSASQVTELYNEKPETDTSTFKTVLYEGNGGTQYISNVGFEPDLVWLKSRSYANNHFLYDSVRGANKAIYIQAEAEITRSGVTSFDSNGFTLGTSGDMNTSSATYVAWVFKGGGEAVTGTGTGVTNVSISANTDAGFSIVKYTGSGAAGMNFGHGLTEAIPELVIIKNLDNSTNWQVFGGSLFTRMQLDQTGGDDGNLGLTITSTTIQTTQTSGQEGNSAWNATDDYIAYIWHSVSGYSKIGSYTGTGSATEKPISTGFEPSFVMIKKTSNTGAWFMHDNKRLGTHGYSDKYVQANSSAAEVDSSDNDLLEFTSTGFSLRTTFGDYNQLDGTYIYMAFK